tara:strand:- start:395 stop:583 length:189 start_codon:yes stop_codon:yes gene_type:complete
LTGIVGPILVRVAGSASCAIDFVVRGVSCAWFTSILFSVILIVLLTDTGVDGDAGYVLCGEV